MNSGAVRAGQRARWRDGRCATKSDGFEMEIDSEAKTRIEVTNGGASRGQ
jgi:hypothetical protein